MKRLHQLQGNFQTAKKAKLLDTFGRRIESMDIDQDPWIKTSQRAPPLKAVRGKYRKTPPASSSVLKRKSSFQPKNENSVKKCKDVDEYGRSVEPMDVDPGNKFRLVCQSSQSGSH